MDNRRGRNGGYRLARAAPDISLLSVVEAVEGDGRLDHLLGEIVGRRASIGWTTGGHTAVDVNLYAFGPGSERLRGNHENAYLGRVVAGLLGLDLASVRTE